ncbi:MAG: small nuclear ribonucleo (LSM1) [Lasallia pustulata]|uniref:U6 snRNA-associated Sm-like protein LSm1 n=1 Tax=Lasallia pustulata TaxID=136370 RepID=A0A1W5CYG8_9LECA|nr:MAG: small nuclear ribonucleo (LSM1) [Lasallia pustulata]SLM35876.1 small nuclear ribonucleoprotein [Lasallia pustulata]
MENLSLHDQAPAGISLENTHPPLAPHGVPQHVSLPPQMFTTAAQLLDLTDKKLMLVLRDGRKLIGVLRSWDQFANLVLQDAIERIFVQDVYADVPRGVFLVRGENVLLLGEIDLDKDDYIPEPYRKGTAEEVHALFLQEAQARKRSDKVKQAKLQELGFEVEHTGEILL